MGRKKSVAHTDTSEDFAKDEPLQKPQEAVPAGKPRTIDMVRAAIEAGYATAKVGLPWIKEKYGVEMKGGNFSVTKSSIERANAKAAGVVAPKRAYTPRQPEPVAAPTVSAPATSSSMKDAMSPSEAARSVKDLVDRLGAKEVKNLVDLFGG